MKEWQSGRYLKNTEGGSTYYIADDDVKWSKTADEVQNFGQRAYSPQPADKNLSAGELEVMYREFANILAANLPNGITQSNPNFTTWRDDAIQATGIATHLAGLTNTSGNPVPAWQVIQSQIIQESTGRHCYDLSQAPVLVRCNVKIGEATVDKGEPTEHNYTDGGLGFMQVQPYNYNWGGANYNLYLPADNILAGTSILTTQLLATNNPGTDARTNLWWAFAAYNGGASVFNFLTPANLRAKRKAPADYADQLFTVLDIPKP